MRADITSPLLFDLKPLTSWLARMRRLISGKGFTPAVPDLRKSRSWDANSETRFP